MSRHLRDTEFVDCAEGALTGPRAAHLDTCAECRAQAEDVAAALREVSAVEMPEPSPLFWEHFSARVHEQVARETPERAAWWSAVGVRGLTPLGAALAILIAVFSATLLPRLIMTHEVPPSGELASNRAAGETSVAAVDADLQAPVDDQDGEVWAVLTAAASDIGVEEAHQAGMGTRIGAVDHEVTHLNQAELKELGRLLQSELKRSSD
jgi:hypothetical protein